MTEQTNPEAGVSMDDAVGQLMAMEKEQPEGQAPQSPETEQPVSDQQEAPQGQAEDGEPTPDDLTEEVPVEQPASETVFEIVHAGKTHTIADRAEQIRLMQQGFDYTQKTQALSAKDRQVAEQLQRLSQVEQVVPQVQQMRAEVTALDQQLAAYNNVNWVQVAQTDPNYHVYRAQYDTLREARNAAAGRLQQAEGVVRQQMGAIYQQRIAEEAKRLPDLIPDWKDPAKLENGKVAVTKHFAETYQIDPRELDAEANSAFKVAVLYKAMKYDQLVKSKADKSKTLRQAPPVTVPGSRATSSAQASKLQEAEKRLRKTGAMEDAVAVLLNRQGK